MSRYRFVFGFWLTFLILGGTVGAAFAAECAPDAVDPTKYAAPYTSAFGVPRCGGTVAQWGVCEVCLISNGTRTASDWYTGSYNGGSSYQPAATFTLPGTSIPVNGFLEQATADNHGIFRVRFAPTAQGTWTVTATSSDSGLTIPSSPARTFTAGAPVGHGFLRRSTAYPTRFTYDDGSFFFMWGQTYYNLITNALANGAWQTALSNSKAQGMNKARIAVYPWTLPPPPPNPDAQPFTDTNHDSLYFPLWSKLDSVISYMNGLSGGGMITDLILFNDQARPYAPIAGDATGKTRDQRYARYILARYGAFPNVIWCLTNEWGLTLAANYSSDQTYWNSLGAIFETEDPWRVQNGARRALSIHNKNDHLFEFFGSTWPAHAIVQDGIRNGAICPPSTGTPGNPHFNNGDQWGYYSICNNLGHSMPVVNDEYGYVQDFKNQCTTQPSNPLTQQQHRWAIWGIAMAGGYGGAGDPVTLNSANWVSRPEYGDISALTSFFTQIPNWWRMTRDAQVAGTMSGCTPLASRVYALSEPSVRYVLYAALGGTITVNLPAGTWVWRVFDPRLGFYDKVSRPPITGGSPQPLTLPDSQDWTIVITPN